MALDVWKEPLHAQAVAPGRLEDRDQAASRVVHSLPCIIHCGPQNAKMKWLPFTEYLLYAAALAVLAKACHVLPDSCHCPHGGLGEMIFPGSYTQERCCDWIWTGPQVSGPGAGILPLPQVIPSV